MADTQSKLMLALRNMVSNQGGAVVGMERRPFLFNPDGSVSTERTITEQHPELMGGRWTNIPTIWDGKELPPEEAIRRAIMSRQGFPAFDTLPQAERSAEQRSEALGPRIDAIMRAFERNGKN